MICYFWVLRNFKFSLTGPVIGVGPVIAIDDVLKLISQLRPDAFADESRTPLQLFLSCQR